MSGKSALQLLDDLIAELDSAVGPIAAAPAANKQGNKEDKKANNKKTEKSDKPAKESNNKKEVAPVNAGPEDASALNINHIDLRVGVIRSVKKHDTAEKLYCEEIDCGEEVPRAIASGLVSYYTLEEMEGRRLIVICNLKPRNLVGFKSHGMVLCASKTLEDGSTKVEFVDPPASANAGDRIVGEGLIGDVLTASKCDKMKAFEILAADLKADADGFATWKDVKLVVEKSKEVLTVPTLRDCHLK